LTPVSGRPDSTTMCLTVRVRVIRSNATLP
jgi:hypothetical protein